MDAITEHCSISNNFPHTVVPCKPKIHRGSWHRRSHMPSNHTIFFRAIVLGKLLYGAGLAQFTKTQIRHFQVRALDAIRPSLRGKRQHRDLALNLFKSNGSSANTLATLQVWKTASPVSVQLRLLQM